MSKFNKLNLWWIIPLSLIILGSITFFGYTQLTAVGDTFCNKDSSNKPVIINDKVLCEREGYSCGVVENSGRWYLSCSKSGSISQCGDGKITSSCTCRGTVRTGGVCCDSGSEYQANSNLICCNSGFIVSTVAQCGSGGAVGEDPKPDCTEGQTALCFGGGSKTCRSDGTWGSCVTGCSDTDGKNYKSRGYVKEGSATMYDTCRDSLNLMEFTCIGSGSDWDEVNCKSEFGTNWKCQDGKCVDTGSSKTCFDSDGSKDYYEQGVVLKGSQSGTDVCVDSDTLREYYCDNDDNIASTLFGCSSTYECDGGKCSSIPEPPTTPKECTDDFLRDCGEGVTIIERACIDNKYVDTGEVCPITDQCGSQPDSPCDYAIWNDYPDCVWDDSNCGEPTPDCTSNFDCLSDEKCDGGVCIPKVTPPPQDCTSNADCESDEKCENGVCIKREEPPTPLPEIVNKWKEFYGEYKLSIIAGGGILIGTVIILTIIHLSTRKKRYGRKK